ncbi:PAS domain-containing protein [Subsaxibacter sp. CAU 1640]|uniref:PAS domain-containing protein n=1 Tax=Subsaxibacter sp. CAU 1640 TaxID=2933271 RepID=UPI002003A18E|nr:PAS domain-containing protein [Subsaxibacter sp. CAU 1640]MCK7589637.1 PAS domain-containing protein [Subsaxibacter sp. CAU 1640]
MGHRIQAKDWSQTPLGDPNGWPAPLKHMVQVMLDNPFGMYIAWGPDYIQIYNDGYRPMIGSKHPDALGNSAKATFPEIWDTIGPMFEGVMQGTPVRFTDLKLQLDRKGFLEDCYFDFAYSPIRLDTGEVGGILVTVIESTEKKTAEISLRDKRDELEFVIEATDIGTFDYNPVSHTFKANKRLKQWFGLPLEEDVLLIDAMNAIVETDRERVSAAIQKALDYESGGDYDITYTVVNWLTKKETVVHALGRVWFDADQRPYRFHGALENITEQTTANLKSEEKENHIRTMILESPMGICLLDAKTLVIEIVNDSFVDIVDHPKEAILGKSYWEIFPDIQHSYSDALDTVIATGEPYYSSEMEKVWVDEGKEETLYFTFVYAPLKDKHGKVGKVAVWVQDHTSQVEARKEIALSENNLRTMILQAPIAIAIFRGADYKVDIANKYALELWGRTEEEVINLPLFECMPELVSQGLRAVVDDVARTGKRFSTPEMPIHLVRNGQSEILHIDFSIEPLYDTEGHVNGLMSIGYDITPQVLARKKIEDSEQHIRALVESAPFPIGVYEGEELRITLLNKSIMDIWGKGYDLIGKTYPEVLPELEDQHIYEQLRGVIRTGKAFHAKNQRVDLYKNGALRPYYFNYSFTPVYNSDGEVYAVMNTAAEVTELHEAYAKLEKSEQYVRALIESAPFPIGVYEGEDMLITIANETILEIFGKGPDVVGKRYTEILPELEGQPVFDQIRHVLRTGKEFHAKNQRVDINRYGEVKPYYFNYSFTPLYNSEGDVYAVMNTAAEVTEIHEAYQKLEDSEKRFRESVKQAPLGIAIFRGPDYVAEMANENYLDFVNKTEEEFLGKPIFESLPEVEDTLKPIIAEIYKTGEDYHGYELPVVFDREGDTTIHYFNFVYHPLDENNQIVGFIVAVSEVTATVEARQLIEENEEKLQLIIEGSELGIFDANLKSGKVEASQRCYEILGFDGENELSQQEMTANIHPEDLLIRQQAFQQAFKTGTLYYQSRIHMGEHSVRWMEARGKVYFDEDGEAERVMGTIRDITEERNFQQQLLEREEKFRLLADSMPQYIWTADPEGNLTYFNQALYDFSGFKQGDLLNDEWVKMVHPDDQENNMKRWMQSVKTGENYLFEQRFRKHNGEYRWQLSRAVPQKDAEGVIKQWVGTSTDIQEQKMFTAELEKMVLRRTKELQQKNVDLEKINKELQAFVYISSHDLQEPLRKIQTFSSRIMDNEYENLSDNAKKHFSRMQNSAYRMQNLIQDLIAYSRTNAQEVTFEVMGLGDILEDVKETLSEELENNKVIFHLNSICDVRIIPVQFKQVIHNLITNSVKFAKADTPVEISISCDEVQGSLGIDHLSKKKIYTHILYSDNGIGFESTYSEKIFEVFQRLHSKDEYSGTGIGLAIVKRIIENHEGAIVASGELGKGATFDIYIPKPS